MKETAGKISTDLLKKNDGYEVSVIEQQRAMTEDYMKNLYDAIDRGYKEFDGDFFIHVETKKEKLLENIVRNYFIPRKTCPTPNWDQSVFKYDRVKGECQYFWTIPDKTTCEYMRYNALALPSIELMLLKFVMEFEDGTLLRLAKKLNNEQEDSPLLKEGAKIYV